MILGAGRAVLSVLSGGRAWRFRILGALEIFHAGSLLQLGGPRHRKLLAVLLVNAGDVVSSERLISALWGESPPNSAAAMLHVRISEIRASLRAEERPETQASPPNIPATGLS